MPKIEISEMEKDALGEVMNISMGSAATAVSELLSAKVWITTPRVEIVKADEAGALGCAIAAAVATGEYANLDEAIGKMSDISGQTRRFLQDSHILALLIGKHYKLCFVNPVFALGRIENQGKNRRKFSKF